MNFNNHVSKPELYTRYPAGNIALYNGVTVFHYILGGLGIYYGYNFHPAGIFFGLVYIAFAFVQMYIIMPLVVCPNCVYYKLDNGLCTSGLNRLSRKIAKPGDLKDFHKRAKGPLSHNKMYMGSLMIPIAVMIPVFFINFSIILLLLFVAVIALLFIRFFLIFKKTACVHCRAKKRCPNAIAMGLANIQSVYNKM